MNAVDALIVLGIALGAVGGYRLGFLARAASWLGMGLGAVVAGRIVGWALDRYEVPGGLVKLIIVGLALLAGAALGQTLGMLTGYRLRISLPSGWARGVDRYLGAGAGVVGVLLVVWLLMPLAAERHDWPAEQAQESQLGGLVRDGLGEPPASAEAFRLLVGADGQQIIGPEPVPSLPPPPVLTRVLIDDVRSAGEQATVKVRSPARCDGNRGSGKVLEGTGFAIALSALPESAHELRGTVIVTNAHVIAGSESTEIVLADGSRRSAALVGFEPGLDLAFLLVQELDLPGLELGVFDDGVTGVAFGHPGGGDLRLAPFEIHRRVTALGYDIHGRERVTRQVLYVSADLTRGDSGAALVSQAGDVAAVVFAVASDSDGVAYALPSSELQAAIAATDFTSRVLPGLECAVPVR